MIQFKLVYGSFGKSNSSVHLILATDLPISKRIYRYIIEAGSLLSKYIYWKPRHTHSFEAMLYTQGVPKIGDGISLISLCRSSKPHLILDSKVSQFSFFLILLCYTKSVRLFPALQTFWFLEKSHCITQKLC